MQASDRPSEGGGRSLWLQRIALLPLVQLPFVFLLLLISYNLLRGETHYVVWSAGLLFACVIVDLLLFVQISRSMESRRTEIEAALLEERLAGYLRESAAVQELLGDTARLRHDRATTRPWWRRCASAETAPLLWTTLKTLWAPFDIAESL